MDALDAYRRQLIQAVKAHPLLWDPTVKDYKNHDVRHQVWEELDATIRPPIKALLARCPGHLARTRFLTAAPWDTCYEFHHEERDWRSASKVCYRLGGSLVSIKEKRVQDYLIATLYRLRWQRNGLWLGANDRENEMEWRWLSGEKVKNGYSNWASGQPSCGFFCFEDCAVMRWKERGQWHDYRCNWIEDYSFICEFKMNPTTTTSTTTTTTTPTTTTTTTTTTSTTTPTTTTTTTEVLVTNITEKNTTEEMPHVILQGNNGVHHGQVKIQDTSTASSLNSTSLTALVVGLLVGLSFGICCIFFLVVRRRRRKRSISEDLAVGYENPYYGEAGITGLTGGHHSLQRSHRESDGSSSSGVESDLSTPDNLDVSFEKGAVGGMVDEKDETGMKKLLPNHSFLDSNARCVMNTYDTPPGLASQRPVLASKKKNVVALTATYCQAAETQQEEDKSDAAEENYYDEVKSPCCGAYDVPRIPGEAMYINGKARAAGYPGDNNDFENVYYNDKEENLYESMEHLRAAVQQSLLDSPDDPKDDEEITAFEHFYGNTPRASAREENQYVPVKTSNDEII